MLPPPNSHPNSPPNSHPISPTISPTTSTPAPSVGRAISAAPSDADPPAPEIMIWQGGPSQWLGFRTYFLTLIVLTLMIAGTWAIHHFTSWRVAWVWTLAAAALGLLPALVRWAAIASVRYTLTSERLLTTSGLMTQRTDELELYRVRDTFLLRPVWGRLLNYGHITIKSSDLSSPELTLVAVPKPQQLHDRIRQQVEQMRQTKQVHELDVSPRSTSPIHAIGGQTMF